MKSSAPSNLKPEYKPISELHILSCGNLGMSWVMNKGRNLAFHNYKNEEAIYYLDIANNRSGENSVVLREGGCKKGAIISHALETNTSGEFVIKGLCGEEIMTKSGNHTYIWNIPCSLCPPKLPPYEPEDPNKRRTFQWIKTPGVKSKTASFAAPDWKLRDKESGEVHAVFVENWDGTTDRGKIQLRRSFGEGWEMSVLVSVGIVAERERARRDRRRGFTKGFLVW
ncbi:uncharacterized protein RCO7_02650 [Rhynchosporium graminicola]|uniref:Uncharacterized protein n=1 Tax=Rhynchosporium graminicola TaxID=2792576 RepID=A0A1E1KFS2_9HELO|nr:uncharacterized protein RCO7_02650 [Rhynchosporium commune]